MRRLTALQKQRADEVTIVRGWRAEVRLELRAIDERLSEIARRLDVLAVAVGELASLAPPRPQGEPSPRPLWPNVLAPSKRQPFTH